MKSQVKTESNLIRRFAIKYIYPILDKGDPLWDRPHVESALYHMKRIIKENPNYHLDGELLILSVYLHDIGYSKFYKNKKPLSEKEYFIAKKTHSEIGVNIAKELLNFMKISTTKRTKILHLIKVHDNIDFLKTKEEIILMEADTLAGLDINFAKPNFNFNSNKKYMKYVRKERFSKFITKYGKRTFKTLWKQRIDYYKKKYSGRML